MYTLIRFSGGVIVEAMVLAAETDRMRMAVAGFADALELNRLNSEWVTEDGQTVELDFLLDAARGAREISIPDPALAAGRVA
jgi:hypothetical protein